MAELSLCLGASRMLIDMYRNMDGAVCTEPATAENTARVILAGPVSSRDAEIAPVTAASGSG